MNAMKTQSPLLQGRRARRGRSAWTFLSLSLLLVVPAAVPHLPAMRNPRPPPRPADAIFVVTGGEGRIQEGYRAWSSGAGRELFILGAGRNVPVSRILPAALTLPPHILPPTHPGGGAGDTLE